METEFHSLNLKMASEEAGASEVEAAAPSLSLSSASSSYLSTSSGSSNDAERFVAYLINMTEYFSCVNFSFCHSNSYLAGDLLCLYGNHYVYVKL